MPRFFKKSHRYNVARNCFLAKVILLDNTTIEFNLLPDVTGTDCLEKVSQVMEIHEIHYFGLQFQSKSEYLRWIDREKPLRKQLEKNCINGARDAELRFRVQFYVTNVTRLEYEIARYLYFLQLKHLVLNGELQCSNDLAVKLASYALQAEFGDYDTEKQDNDFLNDYIFLPPHIGSPSVVKSLTDKASQFHVKHTGMSPASAEMMYIKLAQQLPEYGHDIFQVLDIHGSTIWLGACFLGIFIKHSNGQPNIYFKWPNIYRMKVKERNFGIETPAETVYFKMPDNRTAQYVLQQMVHQHKFYRSEMEGNPSFSWLVSDNKTCSKKKSRSIHDLRVPRHDKPDFRGRKTSVLIEKEAATNKDGHLQRPLHMYAYKEESVEPQSLIDGADFSSSVQVLSISGEKARLRDTSSSPDPIRQLELSPTSSSLPPSSSSSSPQHQITMTSVSVTDIGSRTEENHTSSVTGPTVLDHKQPQAKKLFGLILPYSRDHCKLTNMEDGPVEQEWRNSDTLSNYTSTSSTPKGSPRLKKFRKLMVNGYSKNSRSSIAEVEDNTDSSSQETFDLTVPKRKKLTGSLDQLDVRTPPRSLKSRTFSIAEQEEQEAASGTHDRRGGQLERRLSTGHYFNEYERLPRKKFISDTTTAELPVNIHKNRYKDIIPYEGNVFTVGIALLQQQENRVRLNPDNNTDNCDYINASYVTFTVNDECHNFVVAQGPLEHTCADFWQMVWEERIHFILMVTNELEDCRMKCFRYFPPDDAEDNKPHYVQFDQYLVSRLFVEKGCSVISRGFLLKHIPSGEEREITHLQYIDWPDHGIPDNPQPFLNFLAEVRSLRQRYDPAMPVVVHCSAGVGRSGVVVLMDMLMAKVDCGDALDVSKCLKDLRQQRMHMVQVVGQYKFVYAAIIKYIGRARLI